MAADGNDRVALLLSVEDYASYGKSAIASDIVKKMGSALQSQGFSVDSVTNANNATVRATLRDFAHKSEGARVAIVILAGHGVGSGGRAYLLPSNAEIRRDSDLLSRGVAVASVAQIAGRAKHGAVFFFMTAPDINSTLQSISARPAMAASPSENVVVVFSTSDKVPVSRVGSVSRQAAVDFADAASETPLMMSTLVGSASAGDVGKIVGKVADLDLSKAPEPEPAPVAAAAAPSKVEVDARREAERRARDAEERAKAAEARARDAEARARHEERRAEEARSAAVAPPAEAAPTPPPEPAGTSPPAAEPDNVEALQLVEALLGRSKKKDLQRKLRDLGFYKGPIDAVFGELTRQSIKDFQSGAGDAVTGYLTPVQIQTLIEG
ncbi:MAG: peptidoglycan-binding protein [Alphaproteobacteria bacterium]|nr:peptidoglycan-binding protein [Alphaproteobacteria bacterium]